MKNSKQILTTLFLIGAAALVTGCGASTSSSGSSDLSSTAGGVSSVTDANNRSLATCNKATSSDISAKLKVYSNASGNIDMTYMWVRLTSLPSNFSGEGEFLAFYKWQGNSSGSTYLDSTKLQFVLRDSSTGQYIISTWTDTLKWSDISGLAKNLGITDMQTFFNRVDILLNLNDSAGQYDVLKIVSYSTASTTAESQLDVLLPPFAANPAAYATESDGSARNSALQALHPFASMTYQGWSTAQLISMTQSYCF